MHVGTHSIVISMIERYNTIAITDLLPAPNAWLTSVSLKKSVLNRRAMMYVLCVNGTNNQE
jgi:hypothetical protein